MKIGLVTKSLDPRRGGAEAWTYQHAINLLERGYEVHVIARDIPAETANLPMVIHRLQRDSHALGPGQGGGSQTPHAESGSDSRHGPGLVLRRISAARRMLDCHHPPKVAFDAALAAADQTAGRSLAAPLSAASICWPSGRRPPKIKSYWPFPKRWPTNSSSITTCRRSRIRVVYNGVDVERFSPAATGRIPPVDAAIAWASTMMPCWRLPWPIIFNSRACRLCSGPWKSWPRNACRCMRWLWAASGSAPGSFGPKPRRLPVTFVGPQPDTVPFYAAADMLVHPSFYDSCSLVLLEAAASGLPLLVSRENGAAELLTDGVEGLLLDDSADAQCLAAQMESLFDASLRQKMGAAARRLAVQHTLKRNCEEIISIYGQFAQSRRRAA